MFCPNCGVELSSEGCFCAKCGKNVAYLTQQKDEDADVGVAAELQEPKGSAVSQEQDVPSNQPEEATQETDAASEESPDAAESPEAASEALTDANDDAAAQNEPLVAKTGQSEKDKGACESVIKVPKGKIYYCNECGTAVFDQDNYCYYCGKKTNKKYYHHSRLPIQLSAKWLWGGVGVVAFLAIAFFSYKLTK